MAAVDACNGRFGSGSVMPTRAVDQGGEADCGCRRALGARAGRSARGGHAFQTMVRAMVPDRLETWLSNQRSAADLSLGAPGSRSSGKTPDRVRSGCRSR
jgi:hypothetical protein